MEFQTIIDLIGDKVTEIFNAQVTLISLYNPVANEIDHRYLIERGERIHFDSPVPIDKFRQRVVETRQPWLINQDYLQITIDIGEEPVLEGEEPKSLLFVPMIVGKNVTGIISIQNLDAENAFNESDVRLLQTLVNAMSVSLENARLFDETQRLLKETEERNTELAIINSIGQALTQELDPLTLVDLVGDKLRSAIQTENIGIGLYNKNTNLITSIYVYKNGQRIYPDPSPLNEFSLRFSRQGKSLVLNGVTEEMWKKLGSNLTFGMDIPKSVIMVPILAGGVLIGGITVQDFKNSNAYPEFNRAPAGNHCLEYGHCP